MAILRSPMAHARITRIDVSPALARPGVVAAFSAQGDRRHSSARMPCVWPVTDDIEIPAAPRAGQRRGALRRRAVAVVVASDRYAAADALEAIEVDYEPLPAVLDMDGRDGRRAPTGAHRPGHQHVATPGSSTAATTRPRRPRPTGSFTRRYINQRLIPMAMEPRAVVAAPTGPDGELTLWSSTQIPHIVRVLLALVAGIPEHKMRVIAPDVGGGFGSKLQFYREEIIAAVVALELGRPVKWTESRSENAQATHHGRDQIQEIELAITNDGTILGLRVDLVANMGAYMHDHHAGHPAAGRVHVPRRSTRWRRYGFTCTGVFTTTTPTDAYRGAGRPEATFADRAASWTTWPPSSAWTRSSCAGGTGSRTTSSRHDTISGMTYDSGNYEAATEKAVATCSTTTACGRSRSSAATSGDPVQLGIGISTFTEMCGLAPSRILAALRYVAGGWEHATIRVLPTGKVEVVTGTSPHGQGHVTAWSQIAADQLGVDLEDISVIYGDTRTSPYGMDTYGSRSLAVGGMAVVAAAEKVVEKAKVIAAHMLEADPADLEFKDGAFGVQGHAGRDEDDPGGRVRGVHRPTTCRTAWSPPCRVCRRSTRRRSPSRTARTCAPSRSTPRPACPRSASTCASTTSAR